MKTFLGVMYWLSVVMVFSLVALAFKYEGIPEKIGGHYFMHEHNPDNLKEVPKFIFIVRWHTSEMMIFGTLSMMLIPGLSRWLKKRITLKT